MHSRKCPSVEAFIVTAMYIRTCTVVVRLLEKFFYEPCYKLSLCAAKTHAFAHKYSTEALN